MSKINNLSNKNNGWILCPSKTFPGKFYYFNVVNGETAWSMNEAEKINTKQYHGIHKITDTSHCYPEPDTPPIEIPETTSNNIRQHVKPPNLSNIAKPSYIQQLPTFGQAAFPKYIPNIETCIPSIFWMPIQYPTPVHVPEIRRSTMDQITQTYDPNILVQTCGPCCDRFVNYENPVISFDRENKILKRHALSHFVPSMLFKKTKPVIPNSKIRGPLFETSTPNKKEVEIQTDVPYLKIRKPVFNLETDSNISRVVDESSTLGPRGKVENCNSHNGKMYLGVYDLRHHLLSKRRKMAGDNVEDHIDVQTNEIAIKDETQKKRVSFDLSNLLDEDTSTITNNTEENMPNPPTINQTNTQGSQDIPPTTRTVWYIVVDTDVWLHDPEFVETLILSDKNCKLLIPYAVRADIEALSRGECRGQRRVFVARQLARRCAIPPQHYVVEPAYYTPVGHSLTIDNILECCIDAINDNYQVIIISDDPQLHIKAKSNNITCFKLQDVKKPDAQTQAEIDLKKIKITVTHDRNNVFSGETVNVSTVTTPEITVDSYRSRLFRENCAQTDNNDFDNDQNSISNCESYSTTNEIRDLQNLNLKDMNRDVLNLKRTVRNSNCVPSLNTSREVVQKPVLNSKIGDGFHFLKPTAKSNCENGIFQLKKTVPNSNQNTDTFLFQNAAEKYASMQSSGFKGPSISTDTFNTKNITQTKEPRKITEKPKITEKQPPQNNEPTTAFPFKNNSNSKFKFSQSDTRIPPSFHFQKPNDTRKPLQNKFVLSEQIKNIETDLKRYCVKSKIVDGKLRRRMEEWICTYTQIMENALNDLLLKSDYIAKKNLTPPWTIQEAISNIQIIYEDDAIMNLLVKKYSELLPNFTCNKGKCDMKSNDFMKILGCGSLLIQRLKNLHPDNQQLVDAEKDLHSLLETIECPIEINTVEFDALKTPVVCRSEIEEEEVLRCNFIKEPSYVVDYLKKNYKGWESYVLKDTKSTPTNLSEIKIVRTCGKNLNMLKIGNNKSISLLKSTKDNVNGDNDGPKRIRSLNNNQPVERSVAKSIHPIKSTKSTGTGDKDEHKLITLTPTNKPVTRSVAKSMNLTKTSNNIEIEENKVKPKIVKLFQKSKPTERSNTNDNLKSCEPGPKKKKLMDTLESDHLINDNDYKQTQLQEKVQKPESKMINLATSTHGNACSLYKVKNAGPEVIRQITSLEKYEKKIKDLDLDLLDYSEMNESFTEQAYSNDDLMSISCYSHNAIDAPYLRNSTNDKFPINDNANNEKYSTKNENISMNNENATQIQATLVLNDYDSSNHYRVNDNSRNDSCTNDSGFENDSTCAHLVVKIFFTELSDSFNVIHKFISDCIKKRYKKISEERRKVMHDKAAKSLQHVGVIIQKMNLIITRELNGTSALRALLLRAGMEASMDKRISRYRQFVTKCLEQARILSNALEIIVSLTAHNDGSSISVESGGASIRYFNVFDVTS